MWSVWDAIRQLEERLNCLECENRELREQVEKQRRPLRIRKVVYHVHNLRIDEMSGTMNVGVNAPLPEKERKRLVREMLRTDEVPGGVQDKLST